MFIISVTRARFFCFKLVMKRALPICTAVSREEVCEAFNVILTREIIQKCLALVDCLRCII